MLGNCRRNFATPVPHSQFKKIKDYCIIKTVLWNIAFELKGEKSGLSYKSYTHCNRLALWKASSLPEGLIKAIFPNVKLRPMNWPVNTATW